MILSCVLISAITCTPLAGQDTDQTQESAGDTVAVQDGDRVRVWAPSIAPEPLVGRLNILEDGTLEVADPSGAPMKVSVADVERLEVSLGHNRAKTAGIGAGIGALLGLGLAFIVGDTNTVCEESSLPLFGEWDNVCGEQANYLYPIGGALVGAGIGLLVAPERWQESSIGQIRATVSQDASISVYLALWP
jgi:hypothetical protein